MAFFVSRESSEAWRVPWTEASGKWQHRCGTDADYGIGAHQKISITVDFAKPFTARNFNVFTLEPAGDSTNVTWDFTGAYVYVLKVISVFVSMDRIMGKYFETGLEKLKRVAER